MYIFYPPLLDRSLACFISPDRAGVWRRSTASFIPAAVSSGRCGIDPVKEKDGRIFAMVMMMTIILIILSSALPGKPRDVDLTIQQIMAGETEPNRAATSKMEVTVLDDSSSSRIGFSSQSADGDPREHQQRATGSRGKNYLAVTMIAMSRLGCVECQSRDDAEKPRAVRKSQDRKEKMITEKCTRYMHEREPKIHCFVVIVVAVSLVLILVLVVIMIIAVPSLREYFLCLWVFNPLFPLSI